LALVPGTHLGVYEVVAKLGEGGMGEVYRARDTKLNRDVALKVLPDLFAQDAERLARFTREAQTLASLNHTNIAHIHGLEESGGVRALVMELVEGEDLSAHIARGPMPLTDVLPIARQIAEALEAAHEQGIIHRDLKPANIKLRADGTVKVLDFGLAKALGPDGAGAAADAMNSPTLTARATQMGMILGTAAYMAPEQARGRPVDRRADIWAFGAVLFEMLTGHRAFPGDDVTDTLAAVVRAEPDWNLLPKNIRPTLLVFLRRCLEKDPRQRIGDIHDVRLALDGAFEMAAPPAAASTTRRGRLPWALAAAAGFGMVALAFPVVRHVREVPPPLPPETRTAIVTPSGSGAFELSPDGRLLVFEARVNGVARLWLRPLSATTAQPLAGTDGATSPFWSADSRSIGFFADGLKRLDLGGGTLQTLVPSIDSGSATWNAEGIILFARARVRGPLMRVSASGGDATEAPTPGITADIFAPSFLPDGGRFLFTSVAPANAAGIYLGSLDGRAPTRLVSDVSPARFMSASPGSVEAGRGGGWLVWQRAGSMFAQPLDVTKGALTGEALKVADEVIASSTGAAFIAYRTGDSAVQRQLTWFDAQGKPLGTIGEPGALGSFALSPDGKSVAVTVNSSPVSQSTDLWIVEVTRGLRTRFTFARAQESRPVWSPDGRVVAFTSLRNGHSDLFKKSLDGAVGSEEVLYADDRDKSLISWSPDGHYVLFSSESPKTKSDLWVLPLTGDRKPFPFAQTEFNETQGAFSPDGRWIAFVSDESGTAEIYAAPFPGPGAKRLISTKQAGLGNGGVPVWRPDGKQIFYIAPDRTLMAVDVSVTGTTLDASLARKLFGPIPAVGGRNYALSADGKRFLTYTLPGQDANATITLIQHWQPPQSGPPR
jgi:Tol biopolymer transport system component